MKGNQPETTVSDSSASPALRPVLLKIVLMGAESTGKTTIGQAIAAYYNTAYKEEYGRRYYAENGFKMDLDDFVIVAERHRQQEDALETECNNGVMVVDTNAITTLYFSAQFMGEARPRLIELADDCKNRYDLFFVTDTDVPYHEDGQRSGAHMRDAMHSHIIRDLDDRGIKYHMLTGSVEERLKTAVSLIEKLRQAEPVLER